MFYEVTNFNQALDKAYLLQNIPNPFNNTTSVGYFVPYTIAKAHIVISIMAGQIVHNMELSNLGVGAVSIDNSRMASALYLYTLYSRVKEIKILSSWCT